MVSQLVGKAVPSPCTGVCRMEDGRCCGCFRSIEEISAWRVLTDVEKKALLVSIEQRRAEKFAMRDSSLVEKSTGTAPLPVEAELECIGVCTIDPWSGCCKGCGCQLAEPERKPQDAQSL